MPHVEVRSRRIGGATFQIPNPIRPDRKISTAMKWLISFSRKRNEKSMAQKLDIFLNSTKTLPLNPLGAEIELEKYGTISERSNVLFTLANNTKLSSNPFSLFRQAIYDYHVLIETMRREGYELQIGQPQVQATPNLLRYCHDQDPMINPSAAIMSIHTRSIDEYSHQINLFGWLINKVPPQRIREIILDALSIEREFVTESLPSK